MSCTLIFFESQKAAVSPSQPADADPVPGSREDSGLPSRPPQGLTRTCDPGVRSPRGQIFHSWEHIWGKTDKRFFSAHYFTTFHISGIHAPKHAVPRSEESQDSQQPSRSGNIPALLPKPPLTPLVKLVGKVYSLKCRSVCVLSFEILLQREPWLLLSSLTFLPGAGGSCLSWHIETVKFWPRTTSFGFSCSPLSPVCFSNLYTKTHLRIFRPKYWELK